MESTVDRQFFGFIGLAFLILVVILSIGLYLDSLTCISKWKDSGYESRWSILTACQVKHEGVWIPEKNFRTVD
jgi:hypothetical protein